MKKIFYDKNLQQNIWLLALFITSLSSQIATAAQTKQLAVPPQDMPAQQLVDAPSKAVFSHSSMLPIFAREAKVENQFYRQARVIIERSIEFDGQGDSPIIFFSPDSEKWQLKIADPNGAVLLDESSRPETSLAVEEMSFSNEWFKGKRMVMQSPAEGSWTIQLSRQEKISNRQLSQDNPAQRQGSQLPPSAITGDALDSAQTISTMASSSSRMAPQKPLGYLLFKGDPKYQLATYIDNNFTTQNSEISIVAYMTMDNGEVKSRPSLLQQKPLATLIKRAHATIITPSHRRLLLPLNDKGVDGDKLAGDGLFSGTLPTDEIGTYTSQVQVAGIRPDGIRFTRSGSDIYPIVAPNFRFSGEHASLKYLDLHRLLISVPVISLTPVPSVFIAAEVWGTDVSGTQHPAAWSGSIVTASENVADSTPKDALSLDFEFDSRWLKRAGLGAPFTLKSLRLQSVTENVPLQQISQLPVQASEEIERSMKYNKFMTRQAELKIDRQMLMGQFPITDFLGVNSSDTAQNNTLKNQLSNSLNNGKLLLVHGYCSNKVWRSGDFSNAAEFQDYKNSRSHDDFAQRIANFGAAYPSYGIIAHSQGGAAALQLYAKYWSGLDYASGGRIIQSVGTPYQGTALAGNLALLGQLFGTGCGTNTDLTYSGAANWLSTIPSWARNQTDYYTTSFNTRWWSYDYCHLATDLFLDDPEDGTTEKWAGQLVGGANMGHKKGWCHTGGMRDAAQYLDASRNITMNQRAAR